MTRRAVAGEAGRTNFTPGQRRALPKEREAGLLIPAFVFVLRQRTDEYAFNPTTHEGVDQLPIRLFDVYPRTRGAHQPV